MSSLPTKVRGNKHLKVVVAILFLLVTTVILTSFHRLGSANSASIDVAPGASEQIQSQSRLEVERMTLRPTGFEPGEITRRAGRFLLAVNDRSRQPDTSITLIRETGERLHAVNMRDTARKHEWRKVINLPPGQYVLSVTNHPEWTCRLVLTAN